MKKYTIEYVKNYCKKRNIEVLDYEYINASTKMNVKCLMCNYKWKTSFASIKNAKSGCPKCARKRTIKSVTKYTIEFVKEYCKKRNIEVQNDEYVNSQTKMNLKCTICNNKWQNDFNHIKNRNQGCASCYGNIKKTIEDMQKLAKEKNGKCLSTKYINAQTKLLWQCGHGHSWCAKPNNIKSGQWCPQCADSNREKYCREIIEELTQKKFPTVRPKWLKNPKTNYVLELDGYNKELKIAFEYQGRQHYDEGHYFNRKSELNSRQYRDELKRKICKKKDILLLEPNYKMSEKEILRHFYTKISKFLRK